MYVLIDCSYIPINFSFLSPAAGVYLSSYLLSMSNWMLFVGSSFMCPDRTLASPTILLSPSPISSISVHGDNSRLVVQIKILEPAWIPSSSSSLISPLSAGSRGSTFQVWPVVSTATVPTLIQATHT